MDISMDISMDIHIHGIAFLHLYFQFYYISAAVTWYSVRGTGYGVRGPTMFEMLP